MNRSKKFLLGVGAITITCVIIVLIRFLNQSNNDKASTALSVSSSSPHIDSIASPATSAFSLAKAPFDLLAQPADLGTFDRDALFKAANMAIHDFLFDGLDKNDPELQEKFHVRLMQGTEYLNKRFSDPLSDKANKVGNLGPLEFVEATSFRDWFHGSQHEGFVDSGKAFAAAELYLISKWAAATEGLFLDEYLASLPNQSLPTEGSALVYWGMLEGIQDIGPGPTRNFPAVDSFDQFRSAQNPLIKALAIHSIGVAVPEGWAELPLRDTTAADALATARLNGLARFIPNANDTLLLMLVDVIARVHSPSGIPLLQSIRDDLTREGKSTSAQRAEAAIAKLSATKSPKQPSTTRP